MATLLEQLDRFKAARGQIGDLLGETEKRTQIADTDWAFETIERAARTETPIDDESEAVRAAIRYLGDRFGLFVRQSARVPLSTRSAAPETPPPRGAYEMPDDRRNVDALRAMAVSERFAPVDPGAHTQLVRRARAAELALNSARLGGAAADAAELTRCDFEQRSADQVVHEALGGARRDFVGVNYGAPPIGAGYHYFDGSRPLYRR